MSKHHNFYVYVLFDANGIPRYIGKGHGSRWLAHERDKRESHKNRRKRSFIEDAIKIFGEVPKVKIREHLSEKEAFEIEVALIRAIGRFPDGPLVNRTDNRNGPSGDTIRQWHASRTPEQRKSTIRKGQLTQAKKYTKAERTERARKNATRQGLDVLRKRMSNWQSSRSSEERSAAARAAGLKSGKSRSYEQKRLQGLRGIAAYMTNTTPEQRKENAKKTGIAKLTHYKLSINGTKGVVIANSRRSPEERIAIARKAAKALHDSRSPEERRLMARKAANAKKQCPNQGELFQAVPILDVE